MDAIPFFIVAFFSSIVSLGSTTCTSRRCGFKAHELSIPLKRIDFHICGDQIPSAVLHICSSPRPRPTRRPKTVAAKLKPTSRTVVKTTQPKHLPTSTTTSSKMAMTTPFVEKHSTNLKRPKTVPAKLKPTTPTVVKTTQPKHLPTSTTSSKMVMTTPKRNLNKNDSRVANQSENLQGNFNGSRSHNTSRPMSGNGTVVMTRNASVIAHDHGAVADHSPEQPPLLTMAHDHGTTDVTDHSLEQPPLLTTLEHESNQVHISHHEANSFLTGHANSPGYTSGYTIVEECCVEGCVYEEIYEYCV